MSVKVTVYTKPTKEPVAWSVLALAEHLKTIPATQSSISVQVEPEAGQDGASLLLELDGQSTTTHLAAIKSLTASFAAQGTAGQNKTQSDLVVSRIESVHSNIIGVTDFVTLSSVADELDDYMTLRSFAVGYKLTAADFAIWGAIKSNIPFLGILKRNLHPHLARYYAYLDSLAPMKAAVAAVAAAQKQKIKSRTTNATFELGLPNAKQGQVVTRLPPEPSGYLHIGHCKAAILNQYFARLYNGKFLVRFDDTNPSKEKAEFQDSILEDLELMGVKPDKLTYTSDYFDQLFQYAIQLIKAGKAYTDDTPQEQMRKERMDGIASKHRDDSIEDNLTHFALMQSGSPEGLTWCLRAKISVDDPNKAMRDPVIYRCNLQPHHRLGDKWKIYPGYDFACPIVDSLEGVTHALRTNEYRDRNPQYWWMLEALGLRKVDIWDYGRISFVYTLLSKRKLKAMIEEKGLVTGWDDPRFPTVRGMRRRGLTIEALTNYMLAQGPSQAVLSLEWDNIWNTNKKVIDPIAPRHTAVTKSNLVKMHINGAPGTPEQKEVPKHKKNPELGKKKTTFASDVYVEQEDAASFGVPEEITLMDWGNVIVKSKKVAADGTVESIEADLHLEGDFKKTSKKVHWLASSPDAPLVDVTLLDYDYLITKKKIEDADDWTDYINPVTEFKTSAIADANVALLKKGDIIQFERKGYYIVDRAWSAEKPTMDLILIPDGKGASVALKAKENSGPETKSASAPGISMYTVAPITGEPGLQFDTKKVNMYTVPPLYP